jgi:hypothetical protein
MTPENLIKRQICTWLQIKRKDIFFWVNDSVGIYDPISKTFRRNRDPFRIRGVADILGVLPSGQLLAIEVKTPTGRVSVEQKIFLDEINKKKGLAFVARSLEDVIRKLGSDHDRTREDRADERV